MKTNKNTTLCFSGHRKLPTGEKMLELEDKLAIEIYNSIKGGYNTLLFGGAVGFDFLCAWDCLLNRHIFKKNNVKVIAVVPFENQAECWTKKQQQEYSNILSKCDEVIILSDSYHEKVYYNRNKWLIDHSSRLICYCCGNDITATGQTTKMAKKAGLEIINLYENTV